MVAEWVVVVMVRRPDQRGAVSGDAMVVLNSRAR